MLHLSGAWFPKFERRLRRSDGRGRAREGVIPAAVHAGQTAKSGVRAGQSPNGASGPNCGRETDGLNCKSASNKAKSESKARHKKGEWI